MVITRFGIRARTRYTRTTAGDLWAASQLKQYDNAAPYAAMDVAMHLGWGHAADALRTAEKRGAHHSAVARLTARRAARTEVVLRKDVAATPAVPNGPNTFPADSEFTRAAGRLAA